MNWGYRLMFGFIGFALMMTVLVIKAFRTDFELVEKEYYKSELAFQTVIDGKKNSSSLSVQPGILQQNDSTILQMPPEFIPGKSSGTVWFYCAYAAQNDRRYPINTQIPQNRQLLKNLKAGNYTVKIEWKDSGLPFYSEQLISIP